MATKSFADSIEYNVYRIMTPTDLPGEFGRIYKPNILMDNLVATTIKNPPTDKMLASLKLAAHKSGYAFLVMTGGGIIQAMMRTET